ncbi:50S ribosomal protein L6 [Candidatus Kaiserbacteria bacterium CG10_big_fil_rev_8_21_14_0_10_56_12]|uniref:50S ribosomal protein L6 n=1 Tax=Candidatus Kaiserbacteria bacterium CG10_big_fil_rev_8_21_14_0_10_56_12 TaxID=1974611 RepID=A0A2H0U9F9_9BACT|nr:MAG: 50S ribosomal protein L6 [Candidatus Kaiserbacteria bacterium CG10_big_fil_rev_8_21_14_0_10_56_12]
MSRLAKKPIAAGKAEVSVAGGTLTVKGSKGTLTKRVHPTISIVVDDTGIVVTPKDSSRLAKALTGTFASHVRNMVQGVETPFTKTLVLEGVGYRMELKGKELVLSVGFSHTVSLTVPDDVTATLEKNTLTLSSYNKESVGQFAANVRRVKKPEPYLGKGIRYSDEVVRRKQGKKAV